MVSSHSSLEWLCFVFVSCRDVPWRVSRRYTFAPITPHCWLWRRDDDAAALYLLLFLFLFPFPLTSCRWVLLFMVFSAHHCTAQPSFRVRYYTRTHWHFYCISLHFISIDSIYIYRTLYYWLLTEAVAHNYILRLKSILWYCAIVIYLLIFVLIYVFVNIQSM